MGNLEVVENGTIQGQEKLAMRMQYEIEVVVGGGGSSGRRNQTREAKNKKRA